MPRPNWFCIIEETSTILRARVPDLIVSSPMTRALQSAAILSRRLDVPLAVELDLHEWVPDLSFAYDSVAVVRQAQVEMEACSGELPAGERREWEPIQGCAGACAPSSPATPAEVC